MIDGNWEFTGKQISDDMWVGATAEITNQGLVLPPEYWEGLIAAQGKVSPETDNYTLVAALDGDGEIGVNMMVGDLEAPDEEPFANVSYSHADEILRYEVSYFGSFSWTTYPHSATHSRVFVALTVRHDSGTVYLYENGVGGVYYDWLSSGDLNYPLARFVEPVVHLQAEGAGVYGSHWSDVMLDESEIRAIITAWGYTGGAASDGSLNQTWEGSETEIGVAGVTGTWSTAPHFFDDFNRADSASLGSAWTNTSPATIFSGAAYLSGTGSPAMERCLTSMGGPDHWAAADCTPGTENNPYVTAVCVRWDSTTGQHYAGWVNTLSIDEKYVISRGSDPQPIGNGGNYVTVAEFPMSMGETNVARRLRLSIVGNLLKLDEFTGGVWVNRITTTDNTLTTGNFVGFSMYRGAGAAIVDNFEAGGGAVA